MARGKKPMDSTLNTILLTSGSSIEQGFLAAFLNIAVCVGLCRYLLETYVDGLPICYSDQRRGDENYPWKYMIQDCKELMEMVGVGEIKHIYREANMSANKLAKMGQGVEVDTHAVSNPPPELVELLKLDAIGVGWIRKRKGRSSVP
ncbi:Ribonuclease H domain [Dillenia turbinata]|uniref:Ribonuclease H domain n=1 Tax=Dillenia turbinata TaxID=194707 RepID=A0AAN8ZRL0_9MAGN